MAASWQLRRSVIIFFILFLVASVFAFSSSLPTLPAGASSQQKQQQQKQCFESASASTTESLAENGVDVDIDIDVDGTSRADAIKNFAMAKHTFLSAVAAATSLPPDLFTSPPLIDPPIVPSGRHSEAISQILKRGWRNGGPSSSAVSFSSKIDGFGIPKEESAAMGQPGTYGEITSFGARQLFYYMNLTAEQRRIRGGDEQGTEVQFLDLGSGVGKLVVQAYAELPELGRSTGIELSPTRHARATHAWQSIQGEAIEARAIGRLDSGMSSSTIDDDSASLHLLQGDMFQLDIKNVTHIYVASLCFSKEMTERLAKKLANEAQSLECVATLKQFPQRFENVLGKPKIYAIEMSWSKPLGTQVYFYFPPPRSHQLQSDSMER